jgi:hypothetical protein
MEQMDLTQDDYECVLENMGMAWSIGNPFLLRDAISNARRWNLNAVLLRRFDDKDMPFFRRGIVWH